MRIPRLVEEDWWATPHEPFPSAGPDPTEDTLTCESYEVVRPEVTGDTVKLGEVEASPLSEECVRSCARWGTFNP